MKVRQLFSLPILATLLVSQGPFPALAAAKTLTFFVSTNGNDAWSGTRAEPTRGKTNGPFATVQRALDSVRTQRQTHPGVAATISIRQGTYFLNEPLVLVPGDSNLHLASYRRENVVIILSDILKTPPAPPDFPTKGRQ